MAYLCFCFPNGFDQPLCIAHLSPVTDSLLSTTWAGSARVGHMAFLLTPWSVISHRSS